MIRSAAEASAWNAIVVDSADELLKAAFLHRASLVWIDLPAHDGERNGPYADLQAATDAIRQIVDGLLVVSTGDAAVDAECWARSRGAWVYLPDVVDEEQFRRVLAEGVEAMKRKNERRGVLAGHW